MAGSDVMSLYEGANDVPPMARLRGLIRARGRAVAETEKRLLGLLRHEQKSRSCTLPDFRANLIGVPRRD